VSQIGFTEKLTDFYIYVLHEFIENKYVLNTKKITAIKVVLKMLLKFSPV